MTDDGRYRQMEGYSPGSTQSPVPRRHGTVLLPRPPAPEEHLR